MISCAGITKMIDRTLLEPEATSNQVKALINEATRFGAYSICTSPLQLLAEVLEGLHIAAVVGFPFGVVRTKIKAAEVACTVADGVEEVDMVINIAFAKRHCFDDFEAEIRAVRDVIPGKILKVIIEPATLTNEEIIAACKASESTGADFIKTPMGFHPAGGAPAYAMKFMREAADNRLDVRTSDGICDAAVAEEMITVGAPCLGPSSFAAILDGLK